MTHEPWTPDQWRQIDHVLDIILDLPEAQRAKKIPELCEGDHQLVKYVRDFLAVAKDSAGFLDQPAGDAAAELIAEAAINWQPESRLGLELGPYELTGILGEGGMGVVYSARRIDGQYEAEVAIKLMLAISGDNPLKGRFLEERQILAQLGHPAIAHLLDGGLDPDGHPYIVMERVDGRTLFEHGAGKSLDEKLDLFGEVCDVVETAHRRLILHCDLKPSNILVTDEGNLKLLDFGLARRLGPTAEGESSHRLDSPKLFTPGYASPEQLKGESLSTASDVYSLGILLRGLVTDSDGPTPSNHDDELPDDLKNIIARATAPLPGDRYGTVQELAEDLGRYRDRYPVVATPSTYGYRARRLVDRNRAATVVLALVMLLIAAGGISTTWQAHIAAQERDVAQQEAIRSAAVTEFLVGLFESSDPARNKGADISAKELLDQGAREVAALTGQPDLQSQLQNVMADVYYSLADYPQAMALYESSLQTQIELHGEVSYEVANIRLALGVAQLDAGDFKSAEKQLQACLETARRLGPKEPLFLATAISALARLRCEQKDFVASVELFEEAETVFATDSALAIQDQGRHYNNFAVSLGGMGRYVEADSVYALAELAYMEVLEPDHPYLGALYNNWALVVDTLGDPVRAEELHRDALSIRRSLKHNRVQTGASLINLGNLLVKMNRPGEAVPLLEEAMIIQREAFGGKHVYVGAAAINLGLAQLGLDNPALADTYFCEGLAVFQEVFGEDHPAVAIALMRRAQAAQATGNLPGALVLLDQSIQMHRPHLPIYRRRFAEALHLRGIVLVDLDRTNEAIVDLEESQSIFAEMFSSDHPQLVAVEGTLQSLKQQSGHQGPSVHPSAN